MVTRWFIAMGLAQGCFPIEGRLFSDDWDLDGDGFSVREGDCNDDIEAGGDHEVPGAVEVPYNGWDDDCSGPGPGTTWHGDAVDVDLDGYPGISALSYAVIGRSPRWLGEATLLPAELHDEVDCEDEDPTSHAGVEDVPYDGVDSNCDCADDFDQDDDGFIPTDRAVEHIAFVQRYPMCFFRQVQRGDCDDLSDQVHPHAADPPHDGVDSDCDGTDSRERDVYGDDPYGSGVR